MGYNMARKVSPKEYGKNASNGDIIKVPQYKNKLRVNFVGATGLGVEFKDRSKQTSTMKRINIGPDGSLYLQAGTGDKGKISQLTVY